MAAERYLNHPTFGMLYRVAPAGEGRDVYATLYAQRMFFLVTLQPRGLSSRSFRIRTRGITRMCTWVAVAAMGRRIWRIGGSCSIRPSSDDGSPALDRWRRAAGAAA